MTFDISPFGMMMVGREYGDNKYRFSINGQEKEKDIDKNVTSAKYWMYDSRISHRWNVDPKEVPGQSPYATFNNNPIWHIDPMGDSSVIDNRGYMIYYNKNDKDLRVFMQNEGKLTLVGNLGGTIDANNWFENLLKDNSIRADNIYNPLTFRNSVKKYGRWDYKNLNQSNKRVANGKLKSHILGIAFYRKDKETNPDANPSEDTRFKFDGEKRKGITYTGELPRTEDLNNYHFGVVGKATGLFSETTMLKQAGAAEMDKASEKGQQVPARWRPVVGIEFTRGVDGKGGTK